MRLPVALLALLLAGCGDPRPTSGQRPRWGIPDEPEALAPDPGEGNVLISVERVEYDASQAAEAELLWRYSDRGVEVESGGWGRAAVASEGFSTKVRALERAGAFRSRGTLFVTAKDGGEGEIFLGEEVPAAVPVFHGRRIWGTDWERKRIGASLVVRPRRAGDRVELDLLPRFSRADARGAVTVEEARTRILARPGIPLVIGGMDSALDTLDAGLFSRASREGSRRLLLILTVRGRP